MPRRPTSSAHDGEGDTRRRHTFAAVEAIGRTLPDVEVTTAWGQPALKVHGKMFVCIASHKSAEPNSLVVMMPFADRDAVVEMSEGVRNDLVNCLRGFAWVPSSRPEWNMARLFNHDDTAFSTCLSWEACAMHER